MNCLTSHMYPKNKRGSSCCAVGCSLTSGTNALSKIRMYTFPKEGAQRLAWIQAVSRKDWVPSYASRLCSAHFLTGSPSKDPSHPDWVPSVFPHNSFNITAKIKNSQCSKKRKLIGSDEVSSLSNAVESSNLSDCDVRTSETGIQTVLSKDSIEKLVKENKDLKQKLCRMQESVLRRPTREILKDNSLMQFYTGLDNTGVFLRLLNHIENSVQHQKYGLSKQDQLMLTLMKLKHGFAEKDLAFRFRISSSLVSVIFHEWINTLYSVLKDVVVWPVTK